MQNNISSLTKLSSSITQSFEYFFVYSSRNSDFHSIFEKLVQLHIDDGEIFFEFSSDSNGEHIELSHDNISVSYRAIS